MSTILLFASFCLAAMAGVLFGAALFRRIAQVKARSKGRHLTLDEALEDPVLLFVALVAVSGVAAVAFTPWMALPCLIVSALVARRAPAYLERCRYEARKAECERHLDMFCDIVAMGVDAGLSFDSALELYCERFDNELSRQIRNAHRQWAHGVASRSDALRDLSERVGSPAVKRFADTASHAVTQGAPLAGMLRRLAVELRQSRKTQIEREVARAPIKMLVPTGVCILPAMLLLVMGPMLLQFMGS